MNVFPDQPSEDSMKEFLKCKSTYELVAWHAKYTPWVPKEWILNNLDRYQIKDLKEDISKEDWVLLYFNTKKD